MTLRNSTLVVAVLCGALASAAPSETTLAINGRSNATPWIAAAGNFVAVAWGATSSGSGDVFMAMSRDGGATFASPVRVNALAGEARISGEIAPRVTLSPRANQAPVITVTYNAKARGTEIKTTRSVDGGKTFSTPTALQQAGAAGDRGWLASTVDDRGRLHVIWLDHRGLASGHDMHKGAEDGVAMAQKSGLYYAGPDGTERELFKGVCYCCKTAMATGPDGTIYAAWRHVFDGNMRDMAFTLSRDGGQTFRPLTRVNEDGWSIAGCPDDGPAMAVDAKGTVHLVWPTVKDDRGVILYATSTGGKPFSSPVPVQTMGGAKPSHPQIAVDPAGPVTVAWDEVQNGVRRAAIRELGSSSPPTVVGDATAYPVLASTPSGIVAAWTSGAPNNSRIVVRRFSHQP